LMGVSLQIKAASPEYIACTDACDAAVDSCLNGAFATAALEDIVCFALVWPPAVGACIALVQSNYHDALDACNATYASCLNACIGL